MKIGFIGLGIMGLPMVKNLLKAGHDVVAFDIVKANVDAAVSAGAVGAGSSKEVAAACKLIITMLPNGPEVKEAVTGTNGILDGVLSNSGKILVDMSSIAPEVAKEIHGLCAAKGVKMLDAPVSGGEPKAIEGTLSIMAGGEQSVFDEVREVLLCMGASCVLCGEIGAGNIVKLANQIIVAVNIAAVSEAFALSTKAGVEPAKVFSAIRGGLAGSTVMEAKIPMIMAGNFKPGFKVDLHIKDLQNALDTGESNTSPLPLTEKILDVLRGLSAEGFGQNDHSAIAKYYEQLAKTEIRG
ncbi:MAG: 2-hydroxy-3-oxopropionate reductase [Defluviitaleaceae bacterium]|nr:2-hydroxy-3-oxopropionate reductase [Defluviitaleaceae bacterium]